MIHVQFGAKALLAIGAVCLLTTGASAAVTPEAKCQGGKSDASGKYAACVSKAEKSLVAGGDMTKYTAALGKCEEKLVSAWSKLEAGGACPSTGDAAAVQGFMDACVLSVAEAVSEGGVLPVDVVTCNSDLSTCDGALSTTSANLAICAADLSDTNGELVDCDTDLSTCDADLSSCSGDLAARNAEMRCPLGGIGGTFTATLTLPNPSPPAVCAAELAISGATVTSSVSGCSNGVPGGVLSGTISGNVLTMAEQPNAACGGARGELTLAVDNTCDSASGTFICRTGPGGSILATTPVTTVRD